MPDIDYSKYPNVNFRLGEHLDGALSARGDNKNSVAKRDLERWYAALDLHQVQFTMEEALTLCACLNGVKCTPGTLYGNIAATDEIEANPFKIDVRSFLERIESLPAYMDHWFIIDAVERAWNAPMYGNIDLKKRVRLVGLVK